MPKMTDRKVPMPECDRLLAVREQSQLCGEFLEWLQGRYTLCLPSSETRSWPYMPAQISVEGLLADYFDVDLIKAERERFALLERLRKGAGA